MNQKKFALGEYVDQMTLLLDWQLDEVNAAPALPRRLEFVDLEQRTGVVENFARIMEIAQLVNEFPLPAEVEAAPVFEP